MSPTQVPLPPPPPPPEPLTDDGTVTRLLVVVIVVVAALFLVELLAAQGALTFFAGRLSLVLFLAGSVWCFGFLLLRTANQSATESYDLQRAALAATHGDEGTPAVQGVLARYQSLSQRHWEITQTRSHSAALALYGTAAAAVAGLCVMSGIPGLFWALFDLLAVVLLTGAVLVHVLGQGRARVTRRLDRLLPSRWQRGD